MFYYNIIELYFIYIRKSKNDIWCGAFKYNWKVIEHCVLCKEKV